MQYNYTAILERGAENWSGYFPDVPGCVSTGDSKAELIANLKEALTLHLAGIEEDGEPTPKATTEATLIEIG